jgi:hypothetical protein
MLQYDREDVISGGLRWSDLTPDEWREHDERAVAELRSIGLFRRLRRNISAKTAAACPC